jgi:hypothetical protein
MADSAEALHVKQEPESPSKPGQPNIPDTERVASLHDLIAQRFFEKIEKHKHIGIYLEETWGSQAKLSDFAEVERLMHHAFADCDYALIVHRVRFSTETVTGPTFS